MRHRPEDRPRPSRWPRLAPAAGITTIAVALLACGTLGPSTSLSAGSRPLDLEDPAVGLSDLRTYRAELHMRFEGTKDGEPLTWSQTLSLAVDRGLEARLLSVELGDMSAAEPGTGLITGRFGEVHYTSSGADGACRATLSEPGESTPEIPELAGLLPPFHGAEPVGAPESFEGGEAVRYSLDERSVTFAEGADIEGEALVATPGGYLVSYSLRVTGSSGQFGEGVTGAMRWTYELHDVNQPLGLEPPPGCPPGMVEAPMPEDARDVVRRPGLLTFTTDLDVPEVGEFYEEHLPDEGWEASSDSSASEDFAFLTYTRADRRLTVQVRGGGVTEVWLILDRASPAGEEPTQAAPTSPSPDTLIATLSASLNKTLGIGEEPALASYHLSASGTEPSWDQSSSQAVNTAFTMEADVAGADLHLIRTTTAPGQGAVSVEGYVIDGRDYEVTTGELREALGTISLEWAAWPVNAVTALAIASTGPESRGQEEVEGRPADVYDLDSARAAPATLEMIRGLLNVTSARGTVWIDRESGALLKADLSYEIEFPDPADPDAVLGTGEGLMTITVSRIGQVKVTLP